MRPIREFSARPGKPGFWYQLKEAEAIGIDVLAGQVPTADPKVERALLRAARALIWLVKIADEAARR